MFLVYALWMAGIASIMKISALQSTIMGVLCGALILFVWLPLWVYFHWADVTGDLPATYATLAVGPVAILVLGFTCDESVGRALTVRAGFPEAAEYTWIPIALNELLSWVGIVSVVVLWHALRQYWARRERTTDGGRRK